MIYFYKILTSTNIFIIYFKIKFFIKKNYLYNLKFKNDFI